MTAPKPIDVPDAFAASYSTQGARARAWLADLPRLGGQLLARWELRLDGPAEWGMASLVLPVRRAGGEPAVLKLQESREETSGTADGLRAWRGNGIVRLLEHDETSAAQILERLDASRPLSSVSDEETALGVLADLLARLTAVPAPTGLRGLSEIAAAMVDEAPAAAPALRDPDERKLLETCAAAVAELAGEAGNRLLHWDLHAGNVLAGEREPWLAIDPEPLAGDPAFDLLPAIDGRWDAVASSGDIGRVVLRRFDRLSEAVGADRRRAVGWTLGRVLQNGLWDIEDGKDALEPTQVAIARTLLAHRR
ncbi:aminoglycoside phosphotransferase family protein [Streptomyces qinzhouensis]|uniref:Phosphotransferase n=1 Tax=Streptomyces qinzhouensis TaxID=2599401 RepID=A0A5B8J7Y4_9ACTN|nr:aminoglycoside phosphotransferase family protein [Streptomyces qinzhouensis]QDY76011.1 phosphotransferase [Streptomyces qinzhouensis]